MRLHRCLCILSVFVAGFATGCGTSASVAQHDAHRPALATARLMAAELSGADGTPRVGKPQHSRDDETFEEEMGKDAPHRRLDRRGAGFSGYK